MGGGYEVYSITDVGGIEYDEIWLANSYIETLEECIRRGIDKEKIVICNKILCKEYCNKTGILDIKYLVKEAEKYEDILKWGQIHEGDREITVVSKALNLHEYVYYAEYTSLFGGVLSADDYYRFATLKLLAKEIKGNNVDGAVAELGVYRGKFAKCINMEFSNRPLYLFDTFEGNPQQDIRIEERRGYTDFNKVMDYSDTSVELVLNEMRYPDKVVVRKGYFPDTIPQEDLRFSFVYIRSALYESKLAGLRYF